MINYDLTKIRAIIFDVDGVLSKNTITMHIDGEPMRTVNVKDGYALQLAVKQGLLIAIITGANTKSIKMRYERLGVQDIYLGSSFKIKDYEDFLKKHNLKDEEVIFVGDDIPDYQVMLRSGCACCPKDASNDIKEISTYISNIAGGYGCGRDIIEQVLRSQGKWLHSQEAFGW